MWRGVVGREHPDRLTRPRLQRRRLHGPYARSALDVERRGVREDRAVLDVLDDNPLAALERRAAHALALRYTIPELQPPRRESPLGHDLEVMGPRVEDLDVPEVCIGDRDGRRDDLREQRL